MMSLPSRPGYAFLLSVLAIGAIASTTFLSEMLLGWAAEQNGLILTQSHQANEYAEGCAERALKSLYADPTYAGEFTAKFPNGSCIMKPIGGTGNDNRTLCVQGLSGNAVKNIEILIGQIYPSIKIASWQTVPAFTLCP